MVFQNRLPIPLACGLTGRPEVDALVAAAKAEADARAAAESGDREA
jgi:hypothetical protein